MLTELRILANASIVDRFAAVSQIRTGAAILLWLEVRSTRRDPPANALAGNDMPRLGALLRIDQYP